MPALHPLHCAPPGAAGARAAGDAGAPAPLPAPDGREPRVLASGAAARQVGRTRALAALAWLAWLIGVALALAAARAAGVLPGLSMRGAAVALGVCGFGAAALVAGGVAAHERSLQRLAAGVEQAAARTRQRLHDLYAAQAAQLEALRQEAHVDALTGLATRRTFLAQFEQVLGSGLPRLGLVILRLGDLQGMNRRIGREAADHVLQTLAQTLLQYPQRTDGCFAGRLNGVDFALVLPVAGMARETAQALVSAMRLPLVSLDAASAVHAGGVELAAPVSMTHALALADEALARAEAAGPFAVMHVAHAPPDPPQGEATWQQRLADALRDGRVALAAFPVCGPDGRVLHLDCPLRILVGNRPQRQVAAHWLPMATRARLCAQLDERVLALALQAIAADGQERCINLAPQSLGLSAFTAQASQMIDQAGAAARRLWIDVPESLAVERPALVRELARRWGAAGVRVGLEHAGEALACIPGLHDLGLGHVRVDSRFLAGAAAAEAGDQRRHLRALVQLAHGVGLWIAAEGVREATLLEPLWQLGFDAATGPAVQPMSAQ